MREYNPISGAISKETKFLEDITEATARFFENESLEVLYKNKKREIKAYRDDKNMCVYVVDKNDKKINIYMDDIHSFNKTKPIKEIIYWQYKEKDGKVEDDLHMVNVISCDTEKDKKVKKDIPQTEEEFESKLLKNFTTEEEKAGLKKMIDSLKQVFGEKYLSNEGFRAGLSGKNQVVCSTDVSNIEGYMELLNNKGYMKTVYPIEFFSKLNEEAFPKYQQMLADWQFGMNGMIKTCEDNKHTTKNQSFVFNDSDNNVWGKNNKLFLTDQNVGFYFNIKDDNNFVVYYLAKEYSGIDKEIKRIDKAIKEDTIHPLKDIALKVEDGKITALNYSLMYCFELDMEYSVKAMKEEGIFKVEYPIDITSYQYQKDYYMHRFGISEFEFIAQAMMTIGGGFDYNPEEGNFVDTGVKYMPGLKAAADTRDKTFTKMNYLYPKRMTHLNDDWLDGLKYAVDVLKRDRPKAIAFEGDDIEDALNKAIKYFEIKIKKAETNSKKAKL